MPEADEDYFLPLEDQRVFGAGIRRKRVQFVRSSEHQLHTTTTASTEDDTSGREPPGPSVADKYLSIVLPANAKKKKREEKQDDAGLTPQTTPPPQSGPFTSNDEDAPSFPSTDTEAAQTPRCEVCNLPLSATDQESAEEGPQKPHEASLAHQICLVHSHPPSHLDRTRHGLRYLAYYGWDPDSRLGLGAPGREGIRDPIKGQVKQDTVGLGAEVRVKKKKADSFTGVGRTPPPTTTTNPTRTNAQAQAQQKVRKLNAKEVRKGDGEARRKAEKLREMFFQSDDVQRYLNGAG